MKFVDVFIIGAGPAGSIAGAKLVQEGLSVKIVDKLKFPRFVIKAAQLVARELKGEVVEYQVEYEEYMMMGINVFRDYVDAWYDGTLQSIIFSDKTNAEITKKIVSILSGYVWDEKNSFVTSSKLALKTTYEILK